MGKASREKGKRGERQWALVCREHGYECRRTSQYCGQSGEAADVVGLPGVHIEVKRVERLNILDAMLQAVRDAPSGECTVKSTVPRDGVEYVSIDRAGYVMRQKRRGPKEKINRDEVRKLAGQGWSDPAISKALGFSIFTVFQCRKKYGIPPGQPRRGR